MHIARNIELNSDLSRFVVFGSGEGSDAVRRDHATGMSQPVTMAEWAPGFGGKANKLAELKRANFNVPDFFVVRSEAFYASLDEDSLLALAASSRAAEIPDLPKMICVPQPIMAQIESALDKLCPNGELVAVRSSAQDEDGNEHSFAGQLESFLNVERRDVVRRIVEVWCSGFSDRCLSYRRLKHMELPPKAPCVVVQRMVSATASGVAFTVDPVSGRRASIIVNAVRGLGDKLVSGVVDADVYRIERNASESTIGLALPSDGGTESGASAEPSALTNEQVLAVASIAMEIEKHFGSPQDVEWAYEADCLYVLQARPITSLPATATNSGARRIWDNSNIGESYQGVTTPMTFSFARKAYEHVYLHFVRIMGVPEKRIRENSCIFPQMLGLFRGRIYYNLINWYRLLAMLPGFRVNRKFMEQMMGVSEGLPDEIMADVNDRDTKVSDIAALAISFLSMSVNLLTLHDQINKFQKHLDATLSLVPADLSESSPEQLVRLYRQLEEKLLSRWDAPLLNDFFAMIFFGTLKSITAKWLAQESDSLKNDLLMSAGGIISAEPAMRMREMADTAARDAELVRELLYGSKETVAGAVAQHHQFQQQLNGYIAKFGDRCVNELKLESLTLEQDPMPLLRNVGQMAQAIIHNRSQSAYSNDRATDLNSRETSSNANPTVWNADLTVSNANPTAPNADPTAPNANPTAPNADPTAPNANPTVSNANPTVSNADLTVSNAKAISRHANIEANNSNASPARHDQTATSRAYERACAEKRALDALRSAPWKRAVFSFVLSQARRRIQSRENLRYERTRLFGVVRRIFQALGARLVSLGVIDEQQDVFYLQVEEALGFFEGTGVSQNLRELIALRKREFAEYRSTEAPPDRIEAFGYSNTLESLSPQAPRSKSEIKHVMGNNLRSADNLRSAGDNPISTDDNQRAAAGKKITPHRGVLLGSKKDANPSDCGTMIDGTVKSGLGCCPGIVRGPVRVVSDPSSARPLEGEILVAKRTDPGWIILFAHARAIVVEYGSLLSHTAIVARELGIPAIVSVKGITGWLKDGDWIELDGSTGSVRKIQPPAAKNVRTMSRATTDESDTHILADAS